MANKLTARKVETITKPGRYGDGGGLWLQVSKWGTKSWQYRFMLNGRARYMGLGSVDTFTLKEARERARQARQLVADGIDPIEERDRKRREAQAEAARRITFKEAARTYIEAQRPGWRNAKHAAQWGSTLEQYAYPIIGNMAVADIETANVVSVLKPIWTTKTETASRLRGRIEAVLAWATVSGYRTGDNPAQWRNHLDKILPPKTAVRAVKHQAAMPYRDVPAFMARLRERDDIASLALEFTILTAARTSEVIGATWSEIDIEAGTWTIPAGRIKAKRDHTVMLSERAIAILHSLPREDGNPHVFIGGGKTGALAKNAMFNLLKSMDGGSTVHGFRSSFSDWAGEETNFAREVAEASLAHSVSNAVEAAYRRGDFKAKRRRLMDAWARYCAKPSDKTGEVVSIAGRR